MILEMSIGLIWMFLALVIVLHIAVYKVTPTLNALYTRAVNRSSWYMVLLFVMVGLATAAGNSIYQFQLYLPFLYEVFLGLQGKDWSMKNVIN